MTELCFPSGFRWGAATSSYQIEGAWNEDGKGESNWDRWAHTPGKIKGGGTSDVAVDHYHRWREDVDLMQQLGLNAYRFSIAWARVQPDGTGLFNPKGLAFYDHLIDALREAGIEPFVTLCHYDIPQALEDQGGWVARDLADHFAAYAAEMARRFGDRVSHWMTINEPICIADDHYGGTVEPPGLGDPQAAAQVTHHLLLGHGKALQAIKETGGAHHQVGLVCNLYPIQPYRGGQAPVRASEAARVNVGHADGDADAEWTDEETAQAVQMADLQINRRWLDPIYYGTYPENLWPLRGYWPVIQGGDMETIGRRPDFMPVNYYHRFVVRPVRRAGGLSWSAVSPKDLGMPYTTMGWEIYPEGLHELLSRLQRDYGDPDFYITENGMAFDDPVAPDGSVHDDYRSDYLRQHLEQAARCIGAGIKLRGYFAWSLMDNFEWEAGWGQRFGLIRVDYETLARTVKDSGRWYRDFIACCRQGGI
jgi:beta-glucosidase